MKDRLQTLYETLDCIKDNLTMLADAVGDETGQPPHVVQDAMYCLVLLLGHAIDEVDKMETEAIA